MTRVAMHLAHAFVITLACCSRVARAYAASDAALPVVGARDERAAAGDDAAAVSSVASGRATASRSLATPTRRASPRGGAAASALADYFASDNASDDANDDAATSTAAKADRADDASPSSHVADFAFEQEGEGRVYSAAEAGASPSQAADAAALAAEYDAAEAAILASYEAALAAWLERETALDAAFAAAEAAVDAAARDVKTRDAAHEDAYANERAWARSNPDLDAYAKELCTQTVHHKPVYVPGVWSPPRRAPSVKVPGTPPVLIPGAPSYWEPGRAPFYTPGFWTPGKPPRYVSAVRPTVVPAVKGTVIPGEFVPPPLPNSGVPIRLASFSNWSMLNCLTKLPNRLELDPPAESIPPLASLLLPKLLLYPPDPPLPELEKGPPLSPMAATTTARWCKRTLESLNRGFDPGVMRLFCGVRRLPLESRESVGESWSELSAARDCNRL